jgi:hypothetical protein
VLINMLSLKAVASALLGLTLLSATSASGAVITVSTGRDDGRQVINIDEVLATADGEHFTKIAARLHSAVVSFNSDGGSLVTSIQIGETSVRKCCSICDIPSSGPRHSRTASLRDRPHAVLHGVFSDAPTHLGAVNVVALWK